MKQVITFEITGKRASGLVLLHLTVVLHQLHLHPVALSWEDPSGTDQVGADMLVLPNPTKLQQMLDALRTTDGIKNVVLEAPGSSGEPAVH